MEVLMVELYVLMYIYGSSCGPIIPSNNSSVIRQTIVMRTLRTSETRNHLFHLHMLKFLLQYSYWYKLKYPNPNHKVYSIGVYLCISSKQKQTTIPPSSIKVLFKFSLFELVLFLLFISRSSYSVDRRRR